MYIHHTMVYDMIRLHYRTIMNMFLTENYKSAKNKNEMIPIFSYLYFTAFLLFIFFCTVHSSSAMNRKPIKTKKMNGKLHRQKY